MSMPKEIYVREEKYDRSVFLNANTTRLENATLYESEDSVQKRLDGIRRDRDLHQEKCIALYKERDELKNALRDVLKAICTDRHAVQDTLWVNGTPVGDFIMCALDEDIDLEELQNAPYRCKRTRDLFKEELLEALLTALPYVEDVLDSPEQLKCFKAGAVQRDVKKIREAIEKAGV